MAKKNDNFKKAMNELLGAPAVKEEPAKAPVKEPVKVEEPKKAVPVKETVVKADAVLEDESSLKGNLTAVNVVSNAKSEGQILASGTVELQNLAYVHGDIAAATFSVTSGAKIKGTVTINE